jgi:3-hydroxybutyryl-CoA dehydrogenase
LSLSDKVGVVGAGVMGSEIALMFALTGHPTILSDQQRAQADRALDRLHGLIERGRSEVSGMPSRLRRRDTI